MRTRLFAACVAMLLIASSADATWIVHGLGSDQYKFVVHEPTIHASLDWEFWGCGQRAHPCTTVLFGLAGTDVSGWRIDGNGQRLPLWDNGNPMTRSYMAVDVVGGALPLHGAGTITVPAVASYSLQTSIEPEDGGMYYATRSDTSPMFVTFDWYIPPPDDPPGEGWVLRSATSVAPIPEPSTLVLFGTAAALALVRRCRRGLTPPIATRPIRSRR